MQSRHRQKLAANTSALKSGRRTRSPSTPSHCGNADLLLTVAVLTVSAVHGRRRYDCHRLSSFIVSIQQLREKRRENDVHRSVRDAIK